MGNIIIDLNSAANLKSLPSMFLPLPFVDRFLFRTFFAPAFFPPPPRPTTPPLFRVSLRLFHGALVLHPLPTPLSLEHNP